MKILKKSMVFLIIGTLLMAGTFIPLATSKSIHNCKKVTNLDDCQTGAGSVWIKFADVAAIVDDDCSVELMCTYYDKIIEVKKDTIVNFYVNYEILCQEEGEYIFRTNFTFLKRGWGIDLPIKVGDADFHINSIISGNISREYSWNGDDIFTEIGYVCWAFVLKLPLSEEWNDYGAGKLVIKWINNGPREKELNKIEDTDFRGKFHFFAIDKIMHLIQKLNIKNLIRYK